MPIVFGCSARLPMYLAMRKTQTYTKTWRARLRTGFIADFWDNEAGGYGTNNQSCNAISLYMGLVPEAYYQRVVASLVENVIGCHDGHLTTGNICTKYLLEALTSAGRADTSQIASQETYPSWGFMLANGATTLWERWELVTGGGMNSHNHPMLGSVSAWFYRFIAGIQTDPVGTWLPMFRCPPASNWGSEARSLRAQNGTWSHFQRLEGLTEGVWSSILLCR